MQRALMLGNERFLPEPRNNRGWPRNRRQLEWALTVVRDGIGYRNAYVKVFGTAYDSCGRSVQELVTRMQPFLTHLRERAAVIAEREFDVTTERVLKRVAAVAFADKIDFYRVVLVGGVRTFIGKEPDALTPSQRLAVSSWKAIKVETDAGPEIDYRYRLHDQKHANDFLGKHLGMVSEKLLVETMARRNAQRVEDYSNVSNADLNDAIDTLVALKDKLKNSGAIDVTPQRVVHSLPGGSRDQEEEAGGSQ